MGTEKKEQHIIRRIDAYLKGRLSEEEAQDLWAKLVANPEYLELLETELAARAAFAEQRNGSQKNRLGGNTWLLAAASFLLLVAAVYVIQPFANSAIDDLTLEQIPPVEGIESPDVLRSNLNELSAADSLQALGYESVQMDDTERALELYRSVIKLGETTPEAAAAHLNIGIIQFNGGTYEASVESFRHSLSIEDTGKFLQEKASWYLGHALLHLELLDEAEQAIARVDSMQGIFEEDAEELLTVMNR